MTAASPETRETPRAVKGMRDLLPPETAVWARVEDTARRVFALYGFGEIRTPVVEDTQLFARGVGEGSDIVNKEMYVFADRKGRSNCLRPEATASVVRAYLQNRLADRPAPVKLWYAGPMFRYERPQKGRYRQFHQIGAEVLGGETAEIDAELLLMLFDFLGRLGFRELGLAVNSVGCERCRPRYLEHLRAELSPVAAELCSDCRTRLEVNALRVFDCKVPADRARFEALAPIADFLCAECAAHHESLLALLTRFGLPHEVSARLVRGLDYYTRTVFEVTSAGLGAQDAILGGGRYDRLVEDLGGPRTPGIGFAIGLDRLIDVLPAESEALAPERGAIHVVPLDEAGRPRALEVAQELRAAGLRTEAELSGRGLRAALKRADRDHATAAILIGEDELARGVLTWRDLASGTQEELPLEALLARLRMPSGAAGAAETLS